MKTFLTLSAAAALLITACTTTPEPAEEAVVTPPPVLQTCYPLASLEKVVVPAVVQTGFSITSIETPSEYYTDPETGEVIEIKHPPIESKVPYSREIEPERIYYKTQEGEVTDDICEFQNNDAMTPPASDIDTAAENGL